MLKRKNFILLGSVVFILLAVALVSLLNRTSTSAPTSDVRARAGVTKMLRLNGTVSSVDESGGTIVVDNVYFADESRAGEAKSLGTWTVTAPANFNLSSVSPGQTIVMGIDAKTFLADTHTVTALTITPAAK